VIDLSDYKKIGVVKWPEKCVAMQTKTLRNSLSTRDKENGR